MSIDPVTTDANTGGSFNRYAYANNNPYKYIDPDGRDSDRPSFFTLSTVEALKHETTLDQAVQQGALTRDITFPTITTAATTSAVALVTTAGTVPTAVAGAAIVANGTLRNGRVVINLLEFLSKKLPEGSAPKPPSLPTRSPAAIEKIVKQIKADSKVPQPKKDLVPPPPPPRKVGD